MVAPGGYWCGDLCTGFATSGADTYFVNPATLALTRIPAGPLSEISAFGFVWAGDAIIAVSTVFGRTGPTAHPILSGDMAMFDPAAPALDRAARDPGSPGNHQRSRLDRDRAPHPHHQRRTARLPPLTEDR